MVRRARNEARDATLGGARLVLRRSVAQRGGGRDVLTRLRVDRRLQQQLQVQWKVHPKVLMDTARVQDHGELGETRNT